ncbi:MAG: type II toxin-antitoxin system HipA family toxin [Pseudomonadota bacterium]
MKKLDIYYSGWDEHWLLGTVAENKENLLFEYSQEAIQHAIEFSPLYLPLSLNAYGNFPVHQYRLPGLIADALPDGWGMILMDKLFRKQGRNPVGISILERLALIGDRALGAFIFEPAEEFKNDVHDLELLKIAEQAQEILHGNASDILIPMMLLGGSPHGARPKVLTYYDPITSILSTSSSSGLPWLIKFQAQNEHKEVCALENVYAHLAKICGLEIPTTRYFDLNEKFGAFGIQRFDRENGSRIPIHTLAGLLHADFRIPSSVDYTTFLRATQLLCRDEQEVKKGFERAVFNIIFNNRDDHSKNISFRLEKDHRWRLAPCYDLTWSEGPGGEHQMDVCGEGKLPGKEHLIKLAQSSGLNVNWAKDCIEKMSIHATSFKNLAKDAPIRAATVNVIHASIEKNRQRML